MRSFLRMVPLCALAFLAAPAKAQRPDTTTSPFAGFETRILPNGLKVWFKQAKGFRDVAVSVSIPAGADQDPVGKEQLAHFTEHMAFSDHQGRTEEQIKKALDERGGTRNAITFRDHTFYYAHIAKQHGLFALDWLYGIVSPKAMRPAVVNKQRDPVLIEVGARPPGIDERINAVFIDPPWLRTAGYWKREFGLETRWERKIDLWRSTHAIDSSDLRGFYDRYYAPAGMTLVIIGDLPADSVWRLVDTTFATLPARPAPPAWPTPVDPEHETRFFQWQFGSLISYTETFKTFQRSSHDDLVLTFLERYISERLNDELRFGAHKAVYGIGASSDRRGIAGEFTIGARVKRGELAYVRATVDSELSRLRAGTVSDSEFREVQRTVTGKMRSATNTSTALEGWINDVGLYDRGEFRDYPDFLTEMSRLTKGDVQAVAQRVFVPQRRYLSIMSLVPMPHSIAYLLIAGIAFLTLRAARVALIRPLPMTRLRYVARLKSPVLYRVTAVGIYAIVMLFALRIAVYLGIEIAERWVLPINSFTVQWTLMAIASAAALLYLIAANALIPTKLLVFEDGLAIKGYAYRSKWIPFQDIEEISMKRVEDVVRERGATSLRATWMMTPALWRPALYLRLKSGRAYFIEARDTAELLTVIEQAKARTASVAAPASVLVPSHEAMITSR